MRSRQVLVTVVEKRIAYTLTMITILKVQSFLCHFCNTGIGKLVTILKVSLEHLGIYKDMRKKMMNEDRSLLSSMDFI